MPERKKADNGVTRVSEARVLPTTTELIAIVAEYNRARALELQCLPAGVVPPGYKNVLMDRLYGAAARAAALLKDDLTAEIAESTKKRTKMTGPNPVPQRSPARGFLR